jgi:hypothetical protein
MFLPPMVWFKIERVLRLMWVNFFRRLRLKGEFMREREQKACQAAAFSRENCKKI